MKFTQTSLLSALCALATSAPALASTNSDCHVAVSQLELVHGCLFTQGTGPGPCESWQSHGPMFYEPMTRTSPNHYSLTDAKLGLNVTVVFDGSKQAQFSISSPYVEQKQTVAVSFSDATPTIPDASSLASYRYLPTLSALDYEVSCSFGLSDLVDAIQAAEDAEMDKLGPPPQWSDPAAASLATLPVGSVLELTQDLDVTPGSDKALTTFVEQNGLMTEAGFGALHLPYRFAFAQFYNANNGYIEPAHYPKGLKMSVTKVETQNLNGGARQYQIYLKTDSVPAAFTAAFDPIVRMEVVGRRSGVADIKIPQFAALVQPAMSLALPKGLSQN